MFIPVYVWKQPYNVLTQVRLTSPLSSLICGDMVPSVFMSSWILRDTVEFYVPVKFDH